MKRIILTISMGLGLLTAVPAFADSFPLCKGMQWSTGTNVGFYLYNLSSNPVRVTFSNELQQVISTDTLPGAKGGVASQKTYSLPVIGNATKMCITQNKNVCCFYGKEDHGTANSQHPLTHSGLMFSGI